MARLSWRSYALMLAEAAALRSEDPWYQVGAALLRADMSCAGTGYNGPPSGVELDWADRQSRRSFTVHAEQNVFRHATVADARGGLLAVTHCPCHTCVLVAASYGVRQVVYRHDLDWAVYDRELIMQVARAVGVDLEKE